MAQIEGLTEKELDDLDRNEVFCWRAKRALFRDCFELASKVKDGEWGIRNLARQIKKEIDPYGVTKSPERKKKQDETEDELKGIKEKIKSSNSKKEIEEKVKDGGDKLIAKRAPLQENEKSVKEKKHRKEN